MLRILRLAEVETITGLKKTAIYDFEQAGQFPQRVRISDRASGWRSDEIEEWIRSRPRANEVDADCGDRMRAVRFSKKRAAGGAP